jgi:hypothetical protein
MNEDRAGIYIGYYGEVAGSHFSYHKDGTKHFRLPGMKEPVQQHQGIPIQDVDSFVQVGYQAIPLYPRMMEIVAETYAKEDMRSTQALFVDGALFTANQVDLDTYLLHRDKEPEFVDFIFSRQAHQLHLCVINPLEHFPVHKVAIVILQPTEG